MQLDILIIIILLAIALIGFLMYRSRIDRKKLEEELNNDFEDKHSKKDNNRD